MPALTRPRSLMSPGPGNHCTDASLLVVRATSDADLAAARTAPLGCRSRVGRQPATGTLSFFSLLKWGRECNIPSKGKRACILIQ
ncbi:hypothetical protein NDU88_002839 [Pleurodeles waltl]|uniref:Uncharacterized protein n=1 Tax=Pleurodeles waltl TaxID=8319 RepID=A0AAV7UYE3_PLEWA|nr:hypothetical protein NDU88_002839 [Pleurodeles waltl]